ncbi:LysR family transcriptional regulator [Salinisphaera sp. RV14]|uniref:LysR family transcriptional regulator n=1 Tax=unclassified Salinisphaera TaxID=2649847 RepID=UPI003F85BA70
MPRIDLVTLRLFVSIARERRLTAAAEREHMALAAVSKRISDLEAQLDTPLLYRRPRGVELTPAGDALLHHARSVLESMERLTADLSEYSAGVRGHVRMHANTSAIIEFLPEDLAAFTRARPEVRIDIEERVSLAVIQAVRDGLTDIGVYAAHVGADGLQTRAYRSDRLVLVTPTEHALAGAGPIELRQAIEHDFVGLQHDASLHALIHDAARAAGKPLRMRVQVRSFEGICRMIACGLGIGVLPDRAVSTHVATLGLRTVELADAWAHRELRIAYRDLDALPVLAREMVEHLSPI